MFRRRGRIVNGWRRFTEWVRPELEAEIKFAEWTASGFLRHDEFVSLREA